MNQPTPNGRPPEATFKLTITQPVIPGGTPPSPAEITFSMSAENYEALCQPINTCTNPKVVQSFQILKGSNQHKAAVQKRNAMVNYISPLKSNTILALCLI